MGLEEEVSMQISTLYRCRKEIVTDLDVQDVLPDLLSKLVISHHDKQLIDHENTLEDKAERLLNILEQNASKEDSNSNIIPVFINGLKAKYNWLYLRLTEDVPDSRVIPLPGSIKNKLLENLRNEEPIFNSPKDSKTNVMLEVGGVPCHPVVSVKRKSLLEQIEKELKLLKRNHYLVIQGMAGCGKSVLANQCVRNYSLVNEIFPNGVFWQPIGKECSESKDALLAKMRMLCDKLGESRAPNSFEHGADLLRTAFMKKPNSLLILDDVWRPEVIRAFDVGCKTLVTTRDLSVMDVVNGRVKHIRVDDGFTEDESMELFSQALKCSNLPEEAKAIHNQCKGSPMVISLISSLLQDHQPAHTERWQYYLQSLTKRKYSKMRRNRGYEHESVFDAIALSIENLPEESKNLYADFALFQDDVGIPSSVLMTLWGMQKFEVEDIMKQFVRKSLAVEEYDPQKKDYTYFVHDLLLDYLKYQLVSENLEMISHQKLIQKYVDVCNGEFHKLPDDGYIYFYLGYHLYKAKLHNYFANVYLDLQFIGEKLRITGPADLLVDIRKYLDFIVGDDAERLKSIDEIQTFSQLVGHKVYGQLDVDIIQIALQTPHLPKIHEESKQLARIASNRLYIEWRNAKSGQWKHPESTVLCSDHVICVKFVGTRGGHFIAGLSSGCIQLCDLESSAVCHAFFGHSDSVQSLQIFQSSTNGAVSQNGGGGVDAGMKSKLIMLSASVDKTCKLWDLKTVLEEIESKPFELLTGRILGTSPSPKLRPDQWGFDQRTDDSYILSFDLHTAEVGFAEFSSDGYKVVSTSTNEIMIWSSFNGQIISKISLSFEAFPNLTFQRCRFPPELSPRFLLCSAENQVVLLSAESPSIYAGVEGHAMRIVELLFYSHENFCTIGETEIGIWKISKSTSRAKAFRSRSLSPSRYTVVAKTHADSMQIRPYPKTLDPNDIQINWSNGHSNTLVNGNDKKSPASKSADYKIQIQSYPVAFVEDGNFTIQIRREEAFPSKGAGLFLCAATAKSDNGQLLACGTSDHKIVLWRLDRRQCLGSFTSHNGWVTCLDFSSVDVCALLSGSEDHTVMVWDIEDEENGTKEPQKNVKFSSTFIANKNSDQGHFLSVFTTEKNSVQVYRDSKRVCETFPTENEFTAIEISKCGGFAAVGTSNGKVFQVSSECLKAEAQKNIQSHLLFMESLNSGVTCLKFGLSDKFLVAGCADGSFMIFKDFIGIRRFIISKEAIIGIHFIYFNYVVAIAQDSSTMVVSLNELDNLRTWRLDSTDIHIICSECSTNYNTLGLGSSGNGVFLLNLKEDSEIGESICLDSNNSTPVRSLGFNKNATKLAIGHDNGLISIWSIEGDLFKKDQELVLHKSWVRTLIFSPEDVQKAQWLISCGDKLVFWNLDKHEIKPRRTSFMAERRRRRSGDSPARGNPNRLSLEIPDGSKIGRQGKRELLQQFSFRGNYAQNCFTDPTFSRIVTVDDTGIFYLLETLKIEPSTSLSAKI